MWQQVKGCFFHNSACRLYHFFSSKLHYNLDKLRVFLFTNSHNSSSFNSKVIKAIAAELNTIYQTTWQPVHSHLLTACKLQEIKWKRLTFLLYQRIEQNISLDQGFSPNPQACLSEKNTTKLASSSVLC